MRTVGIFCISAWHKFSTSFPQGWCESICFCKEFTGRQTKYLQCSPESHSRDSFIFKIFNYLFISYYWFMECGVGHTMCLWKLEDNLLEWVLSFCPVGSWNDQTQVLSFAAGAFTFEAISDDPVLLATAVFIDTNLIGQNSMGVATTEILSVSESKIQRLLASTKVPKPVSSRHRFDPR